MGRGRGGAGVADFLAWVKHRTSAGDIVCASAWRTRASCCQPVNYQADDTRGAWPRLQALVKLDSVEHYLQLRNLT
jgi:hypothetical protein